MRYELNIKVVESIISNIRSSINPEMRRDLEKAIGEGLAIHAYDNLFADRIETQTHLYILRSTGEVEGWRSFEVRRVFGERYVCCGVCFDDVYLDTQELPPLIFMPQPYVHFYGWGVFTGNQQAMNVKVRDLNEF